MPDIGRVKEFVRKFVGAGDPVCDGDLIMTVDSGEGFRLGTEVSSDFGWRDLEGAIDVKGVGLNDPDWAQIGTTDFFDYQFLLNDEAWFNYHVPHDWVPNSPFYMHAHWLTDGTSTATVKWEWTLAYADGYNTAAFPLATPTVVTVEQAASGTLYQHMISEVLVTGFAPVVDGIIKSRVRRITNGGTDNTDAVFLQTCDLHYQSTGLPTKNRNGPNFYS